MCRIIDTSLPSFVHSLKARARGVVPSDASPRDSRCAAPYAVILGQVLESSRIEDARQRRLLPLRAPLRQGPRQSHGLRR